MWGTRIRTRRAPRAPVPPLPIRVRACHRLSTWLVPRRLHLRLLCRGFSVLARKVRVAAQHEIRRPGSRCRCGSAAGRLCLSHIPVPGALAATRNRSRESSDPWERLPRRGCADRRPGVEPAPGLRGPAWRHETAPLSLENRGNTVSGGGHWQTRPVYSLVRQETDLHPFWRTRKGAKLTAQRSYLYCTAESSTVLCQSQVSPMLCWILFIWCRFPAFSLEEKDQNPLWFDADFPPFH